MTIYAKVQLDTNEPDLRDRVYFELTTASDTENHTPPPVDGVSFFTIPYLISDCTEPDTSHHKQVASQHILDMQMVYALRHAAQSEKSPAVKAALLCLATVIHNYSLRGQKQAAATAHEMATYLAKHHTSRPYRAAFQKACAHLQDAIAQFSQGLRYESDLMYGKVVDDP